MLMYENGPVRRSTQCEAGYIIINKPAGPTSNDCLRQLKKSFPRKIKVGFCGTLDPFAEGVLPIALGEATKTISYLLDTKKTYHFTIRWGIQTDTDDREGRVEGIKENIPTLQALKSILPTFMGQQMQTPPPYSAKKISGQRAYNLARQGQEVVLQPCPIHIYDLRILDRIDDLHTSLAVTCSKGTYVRALARDIAHRLDSYGHITKLVRNQVGPFSLDQAIDLDVFVKHPDSHYKEMLSIPDSLIHLFHYILPPKQAKAFKNGQQIDFALLKLDRKPKEAYQTDKDVVLCMDYLNKPVGLAKIVKKNVQPIRIFHIIR